MRYLNIFMASNLLLISLSISQPSYAQSKCERRSPEDVRLLIRARDAAATVAALRCRKELTADSLVRGGISYAFSSEAFESNRSFLGSLKASGLDFLVDFAPLNPEDQRDNHLTPLGAAIQTANLDAVKWLLSGSKPNVLRAYRRLAYTSVQPLFGRGAFGEEETRLVEIIRITTKAALPVDFDQYRAYRDAMFVWWRTQDSVDYTDNSFAHRTATQPLPKSLGPIWSEITDLLSPKEQEVRTKIALDAAKMYGERTLTTLDYQRERLKNALSKAGAAPGAMVVDMDGIIGPSPLGRVPKESMKETLDKIDARARNLRSIMLAQSGGKLPDWALSSVGQSVFGDLFGLRLGTNLAELLKTPTGDIANCATRDPSKHCATDATKLTWDGDPKLAASMDTAGKFSGGTGNRIPFSQWTVEGLSNASGVLGLIIPNDLLRPGLPKWINVELQNGRVTGVAFQGTEQAIAAELRRLWGDESASTTSWIRVRAGYSTTDRTGSVFVPGVGVADFYQRRHVNPDDQPVTTYQWLDKNGSAEMRCAMSCNIYVRWTAQ